MLHVVLAIGQSAEIDRPTRQTRPRWGSRDRRTYLGASPPAKNVDTEGTDG